MTKILNKAIALLAAMSVSAVTMSAPAVAGARNFINSQGELMLYGVIGDWWDGLDAMSVVAELERINPTGDLHVRIHSEGGSYLEGLAIYNALKQSPRRVVVTIDGMALSMATFIALAGDEVRMPRNAWQFFHFAGAPVNGNHEDLRSAADQLEAFSQQAAELYAENSDFSVDEWLNLMRGNTWMNAQQCLDAGLIDTITDPLEAVAHHIALNPEMMIPAGVMEFNDLPEAPQPAAADENHEEEDDVKTAQMNAGSVPASQTNPATPDAATMRAEAAAAERTRQAELRTIAAQSPTVVTSEMLAEWCDDAEMTADAARKVVLDKIGKMSRDQMPSGTTTTGGNSANMQADIAAAVLHRVAPSANRLDGANEFAHMSLLDISRRTLELNGRRTAGMSAMEIAAAALQTTSDLPNIFADVASNELARGYAARQRTFTAFATQRTLSNFKPQNITRMSDAPVLLPKTENGGYEIGHLEDSKETIALQTKGRMVMLSREMIINDDLDALSRLPMMLGAQAALAEIRAVYKLIGDNVKVGETGKTLFHADHKNLGTAGAISVDMLGELRKLLRKQKSKAAKGEEGYALNTPLDYLLVPAALETEAEKLITQIAATKTSDVNPFNNLKLIIEAELDDYSTTAYYGLGAPELVDTLVYGYLDGQQGAYIDSEVDFNTDGIKMKVRHDFAASVADFRGMVKNAGA